MKKFLALVMIAAPLYLAGCDKNGNNPLPDADAEDALDAIPEPTPDVPVDVPVEVPDEPAPDLDDDACTAILGGICNVVEQCGCMPAYACVFAQDSATCEIVEDCQSGTGTLGPGEECTGNECAPGSSCLCRGTDCNCHQWCFDSSDCSVAGRECTVNVNFTLVEPCSGSGTVTPYMACDIGCPEDIACNLFAADVSEETVCTSGEQCVRDNPISGGGCDLNWCTEAGTLAEGADCASTTTTETCGYGMGCYGSTTTGEYYCRKYCETDGADDHTCSTGTCTAIGSEAWATLGICVP